MAEVVRKDAPLFGAPSATFADGRVVRLFFLGEEPVSSTGRGPVSTRRTTRVGAAVAPSTSGDGCLRSHLRHGTTALVNALRAAGIVHRHDRQTSRTTFAERIGDLVPTGRTDAQLGSEPGIQGQIGIGFLHGQIRICDSSPPTRKAPTHVTSQMMVASFVPRSFSMTMSEAMQGTNSVIVTKATTI